MVLRGEEGSGDSIVAKPADNRKARARKAAWVVGVCVALFAIVLIATPYAIRWYLVKWLSDNGAIEVAVDDVDFNPFLGRARITGVHFTSDDAPQGADQIVLRVAWGDLLARQVMFERIVVRNARIGVRRTETNRLFLAAVAIGGAEAVDAAQEVEEASGWGVGLAGVELENVSVHYVDPLLDYDVNIPAFSVDRMATWEPDRDSRLSGRIEIGNTFFELDGAFRPFAENFLMQAAAKAGNVPLAAFHKAFPEWGLDALEGTVALDGGLDLAGKEDGDFLVVYEGRVDGAGTSVAGSGSALAIEAINWDGRSEVTVGPDGVGAVIKGDLSLESVNSGHAADGLTATADSVSWVGEASVGSTDTMLEVDIAGTLSMNGAGLGSEPSGGSGSDALRATLDRFEFVAQSSSLSSGEQQVELAHSGSLLVDGLTVATGGANVKMTTVEWKGDSGLRTAGEETTVTAAGDLGLAALAVDDGGGVSTGLEAMTWTGKAQAMSGSPWRFDVDGGARLDDLEVTRNGVGLLRVAGVSATFDPTAGSGAIDVRPLELDSVAVLKRPSRNDDQEPEHVVEVRKVSVSSVSAAPDHLDLGEIGIDGMQVWLAIAPEGKLELRDMLATISEPPAGGTPPGSVADKDTAGPSDAPDFRYSVAGVRTVNPLTIDYRDDTVSPKVSLSFTPMNITVGRIDSSEPENDTDVKLTTGLGRYGKLGYDGTLRPLADKLTAIGTGTVDALDITAFDGYSRRNNGYRVDSGTLSADVKVDIRDDQVDSLAEFVIRELDVVRIIPEEQDELGQELGVPLDVAFSLLKDKQDNINLDVPLEGDLSELSADFGHALRIVLNKGIMVGVRTAATTFFAPLWPVLAAEKVVGAMTKLKFKAVEFVPGGTDMTAEGAAYLDELAGLVGERPEFSLKICGRAVTRDRAVLFPDAAGQPLDEEQLASLKALAVDRQLGVKDALIERGIEAARVVTCAPVMEDEDPEPPRVDVGI